jgi:hypothetical protein
MFASPGHQFHPIATGSSLSNAGRFRRDKLGRLNKVLQRLLNESTTDFGRGSPVDATRRKLFQ